MSNARNIANLPNGFDDEIYGCRAYIVIKDNTVVANKNITSVSVSAIGNYEKYVVQFTQDMPNANYAILTSGYSHQVNYGEGVVGLRIDTQNEGYPSVSGFTLTYQSNTSSNLNYWCAGVII